MSLLFDASLSFAWRTNDISQPALHDNFLSFAREWLVNLIQSLANRWSFSSLMIGVFVGWSNGADLLFRRANEQGITAVITEHSSDFLDTRASNDQSVLASLFSNNHNPKQITDQASSSSSSQAIPLTTILPTQTKSRTEVWISRLPSTSPVTETDYESQVWACSQDLFVSLSLSLSLSSRVFSCTHTFISLIHILSNSIEK